MVSPALSPQGGQVLSLGDSSLGLWVTSETEEEELLSWAQGQSVEQDGTREGPGREDRRQQGGERWGCQAQYLVPIVEGPGCGVVPSPSTHQASLVGVITGKEGEDMGRLADEGQAAKRNLEGTQHDWELT